jgi:undecaprenyl-diphosphatase
VTHRVGAVDWLFVALSRIGTLGLVWIVLAVVAAYVMRRPAVIPAVIVATIAANLVAFALKDLTSRDRPAVRYAEPEALVHVPRDGSFPSGHSATSFAAAAILAWVFPQARVGFYVLATAIAFSRVYVGVHYPLDVLAGAILGLAIGFATRWMLARRTRHGARTDSVRPRSLQPNVSRQAEPPRDPPA